MPKQKRAQSAQSKSAKSPARSMSKGKQDNKASKTKPDNKRASSRSKAKVADSQISLKNQAKASKANHKEIAFKEDEFVAIVDVRDTNEERFDTFSLAQVAEDSMKGDAEIKVRVYKPTSKAQVYSQETPGDVEPIKIFDYQVLSSIKVKLEKKGAEAKISQTDANKITKLFDNQIDAIKERLGISDDEEESDKEEEADKGDVELASDKEEEEQKVVKAKRTGKASQPTKMPVRAKSSKRAAKKASDDEDGEESEELQIGKKRGRNPAAASQSVSRRAKKLTEDDEVDMPKSSRAKNTKVAKEPKWKSVLKIGKWNPNTKLIETEAEKSAKNSSPVYSCCLACNVRNVYRAIETRDQQLLKTLVHDVKNVPTVNCGWSQNSELQSLLTLLVSTGDIGLLKAAFDINLTDYRSQVATFAQDGDQWAISQLFVGRRSQPKEYLLNLIKQGQVSAKAYGTKIRTVEMTRGNRQGNNAFLDYEGNYNVFPSMPSFDLEGFERSYFFRNLTPEFYKALSITKCFKSQHDYFNHLMHEIARTGNRVLLMSLLEPLLKHDMYGYNQLHLDVLKNTKLDQKYATQSLTKKAMSAENVTPIHFACINPSVEVLKKLLEQNQEVHVTDNNYWKPLHYAAACEGPGPLQLLLGMGASVYDMTNQKQSALHIAAINGRTANIKLLLEHQPKIAKLRDRQTNTAMVYALKLGEIEPIQAFLDSGAVKIGQGQGKDRMQPLHFAAAQGNYELTQFLLERKAKVLAKDKFKRTPLIMACKNGHAKVASLLLQHGSDWNQADSSQNFPIHYAAGYGWLECINLLVENGADLNSNNMWKVSPITVAMLKNHSGIVRELLKHEGVDVNGKDDKGLTLLHMACVDLSTDDVTDFVKFLLSKGADPNLADLEGQTPLHILATYKSRVRQQKRNGVLDPDFQKQVAAEKRARLDVIDMLIENGASLNTQTVNGETPFSLALKENQIDVLHKFVDNVKLSESPMLFHHFTSHLLDERYHKLLVQMMQKENLTAEVTNVLNKDGFTPFLAYIKHFTEQVDMLEMAITRELLYAEWKQKQDFTQIDIKNIHLFDQTCNSSSDPRYQEYRQQNSMHGGENVSYFSAFELKDRGDKLLAKLVLDPFIQLLRMLVKAEADPFAKVDKLEFYRELDKHKQKLFLVEETREGVSIVRDQEMKEQADKTEKAKSTTVASTTANNVKSRKEVLAERTYEQKVMKNKKRQDGKGTNEQKDKRRELHKQLKRFYAEKDFVPRFETINGKKVEQEYVRVFGLQNAIHLLMRRPVKELFNYLIVDCKVPIDEIDNEGLNPVYIAIKSRLDRGKDTISESTKLLIERGANCDLADRQGQTPFLHLYNKAYKDAAFYLLSQGANINAMSKVGVFALKMALIRRNNEEIKALVDRGADINQLDHLGRNLLHEAVKMSSATADATFETEQLIIDLGVKVNQRDSFGRVPLHYAFVKNGRSTLEGNNTWSTDPIETVSSLCAQKQIEIDVADKWEKTPLHYASMMGSTISVIYLIQRGASTKSVDIYGNTPLGVAMLYKQFNYAITLIQKNADVKVPVYDEFPNRIDKMWADQEKERQRQLIASSTNADMTESEHSEVDEKKHRELFAKKAITANIFHNLYDSDYDDEADLDDSSEESEGSVMEKQVYNQNAFGMQNLGIRQKKTAKKTWDASVERQEKAAKENIEPVTEPKSTFRHAIKNGQQGVAYLILDNGYDYMLAMQDAMDESKFQLVLTLLSKTADDKIIQRKNAKGQNLMHILSQNAKMANFQVLERIYNTLKNRGVDCLAMDNQKNNALHFAVQSRSQALVKILISEKIDVNAINALGHSPLSLFFVSCKTEKGLSNLGVTMRSVNTSYFQESIIQMLAKAGANFNHVYNDYKEKPQVQGQPAKEESNDEIDPEDETNYKSTILINQIKHCEEFLKREAPEFEMQFNNRRFGMGGTQPVQQPPVAFSTDMELMPTLEYLMSNGATFNIKDSKGREVMSYAIENNDLAIVKYLISHASTGKLLINNQDEEGKSAFHYVVNPVGFGSYENVHIFDELKKAGYKTDLKDISDQTPLDYANQQSSGVLAAKFREAGQSKRQVVTRKDSATALALWPKSLYDPEADSHRLLEEAEAKQNNELLNKDEKPDYIPLDIVVQQEKQYKVFYDEEKRPYDCYLTKVDLANGLYGAYLFYKIQLLHDTNRDLYVVLTRYGRIGEVGMNQRSPFNNAADAIADFSTIFKSKTGNDWATAHTSFCKMPKKYNLVQVHHTRVKHQDYLAPFDFESCKPSENLSKKVKNFIEEISNVTMYQRAIQTFNVDTEVLPISGLKKETLLKAKEILAQIKDILENSLKQWYRKDDEEFEQKQKLAETLGELSSKYFELIPFKENQGQNAAPIRNINVVKRQAELIDMLLNVEFSSRILLGALYHQYNVNPIEYIYDCMAAKIFSLSAKDPETQLIINYCKNTAGSDLKNIRIFKIERKGEAERFAPFKKEPNRMLLFHGSAMSNYLGILSQGLRIAPPEAPTTGYMFGKGVYFADMFRKSDAYAHGITSKVLILCEVALGNMKKLYEANYIENLEKPFLSVKGCGRNGPDLRNKLVITPQGFAVPTGLPMKYPDRPQPSQAQQQQMNPWMMRQAQMMGGYQLMHNEYIVFNTDQIKMRYLVQIDLN